MTDDLFPRESLAPPEGPSNKLTADRLRELVKQLESLGTNIPNQKAVNVNLKETSALTKAMETCGIYTIKELERLNVIKNAFERYGKVLPGTTMEDLIKLDALEKAYKAKLEEWEGKSVLDIARELARG